MEPAREDPRRNAARFGRTPRLPRVTTARTCRQEPRGGQIVRQVPRPPPEDRRVPPHPIGREGHQDPNPNGVPMWRTPRVSDRRTLLPRQAAGAGTLTAPTRPTLMARTTTDTEPV